MKHSKILMADPSAHTRMGMANFVNRSLSGYTFVSFASGTEALEDAKQHGLPHVALVGLSLPDMHGFELAAELQALADVPIILTASESDADMLSEIDDGLHQYADDFVIEPYPFAELELRIRKVLSRMPSFNYTSEPIIAIDDYLSIDFARNLIVVSGQLVGLTFNESALLRVLLRNATRVVENRTLLARVWPSGEIGEGALRVHMHRLRSKLELDSHYPHYILTERGVGYRFTQPLPEILDGEPERR